MPRKIMKEFSLEEVSFVRDPAQTHALATIRKSATPKEDDMSNFDSRVAELKKKGMSGTAAMQQARQEMPEAISPEANLFTVADAMAAPVRVAKSAAVIKFEQRVAEVRGAQKCSHTKAMIEARKLYPQEFEAYQNG